MYDGNIAVFLCDAICLLQCTINFFPCVTQEVIQGHSERLLTKWPEIPPASRHGLWTFAARAFINKALTANCPPCRFAKRGSPRGFTERVRQAHAFRELLFPRC